MLEREGWTRVQAGAWIEPGRDADLATRLRAVQLLKPRLVVSHRSATALWRIETLTPVAEGTLELIDPDLTLRSGGKGVLVHRMPLDEETWSGVRAYTSRAPAVRSPTSSGPAPATRLSSPSSRP